MLICGSATISDILVLLEHSRYTLAPVKKGPGLIIFFGLNIAQRGDHSISVDSEENPMGIKPFLLSRIHHGQQMDPLNSVDISLFASVNSFVGWIAATTSFMSA